MNNLDPYLPKEAEIFQRIQESPTIFTLQLRFTDPETHKNFVFQPGQFNMLYLYGVGEVAISIVSDPESSDFYDHTIRVVGRVTKGLAQLRKGDRIGVRGPFGRGWPLTTSRGKDIVIVTGGLGCAPVMSVINYMMQRRDQYGAITILQGVKHSDDFIFHQRFEQWEKIPNTKVYVAADRSTPGWRYHTGLVTEYLKQLTLNSSHTVAMLCGPEMMMQVATQSLLEQGIAEKNIFLSMERNMACAIGHCGHCQYGGLFICKDGPIFSYSEIKKIFAEPGF